MRLHSTPIFVTGCAGFIGFHLSKRLLNDGYHVIGMDNLNDYYDVRIKKDRLSLLKKQPNFSFFEGSIEDYQLLDTIFNRFPINIVFHFAAQAGVRYSLENPHVYIQSNLVGFGNILECCTKHKINHLIYASSSSVYGNNEKIPFSVQDRTDQPISLYAATKKANELMAYTYSHIYKLPATGLRLFTVYGPWGRPDMALFKFTNAIFSQNPIQVFNFGNMKRDFTFIDDVIESIIRLMKKDPPTDSPPYKIYNIGNNNPVPINAFIEILEKEIGRKAVKTFLPMQSGDVQETYAQIDDLIEDIQYKPRVTIQEGVKEFIKWYKDYYKSS
jgi:UDP-glucuronate 4-epimerase